MNTVHSKIDIYQTQGKWRPLSLNFFLG